MNTAPYENVFNKILVVEDEKNVRKLISDVLQEEGYKVIEASDGKEAIDMYRQEGYALDLIISDLKMPRVDGEGVAEFNFLERNHPFIICSGISDARVALRLLQYGVQDYLVKPIYGEQLLAVVRNALNRSINWYLNFEESKGDGNVGYVEIPSKRRDIAAFVDSLKPKVEPVFGSREAFRFIRHLTEFLMNAHEHGNMRLDETTKARLILSGELESEIRKRELKSIARIQVKTSILEDRVAVEISDEGDGFDYERYLDMSDEEIIERLEEPNGRGLILAARYFDSVEYLNGGSTVELLKYAVPRSQKISSCR